MRTGTDRIKCPSCGSNNMPNQAACWKCSRPFAPPAQAKPRQQPGSSTTMMFVRSQRSTLLIGLVMIVALMVVGFGARKGGARTPGLHLSGSVIPDTRIQVKQIEYSRDDTTIYFAGQAVNNSADWKEHIQRARLQLMLVDDTGNCIDHVVVTLGDMEYGAVTPWQARMAYQPTVKGYRIEILDYSSWRSL
jgi:hypothetical protein